MINFRHALFDGLKKNLSSSDNGTYQYYFHEIADQRVKDWPFMENPYYGLGTIFVYLLVIYGLLPRYMAHRKPYELKTFIQCYNLFQVVGCSFLVHGAIKYGWQGWSSLSCYAPDFSDNEASVTLAGYFWWNLIIKCLEFTETIIFTLRKKNNQISFLHVYHHISTFIVAWISCKYLPGGMSVVTLLFNSLVHILMYSYYYFASLGPSAQKKLVFIKSKITIIQLTQLIFFFFHTLQVFFPDCNMPKVYGIVYLPITAGNIILFLKFYRKTYVHKKIQ